ncbi:MAG: thymidine kinase, partial [Gammaproteobacteria bacterium]|nr:thymidine kinase [Gammaproteobacteria bacterium]
MAKLYFYYSSMNAGKTTALLQASYNYRERGMDTMVLSPLLDDRYGAGRVESRIGLKSESHAFRQDDDLFRMVSEHARETTLNCVMVDEAQF